MTSAPTPERIAERILALCRARAGHTICPSEVARGFAEDEAVWRPLMPEIRAVAAQLAAEGRIEATQKGMVVDIETARGPIRLRAVE